MKLVAAVVAIAGLVSCTASERFENESTGDSATIEDVEQFIVGAEQEKATAMAAGPAAHLRWADRWIADDIIFTGADGQVSRDTKAQVRNALSTGLWRVNAVSVDSIRVNIFGDAAVVTALQTEDSQMNGVNSGGRFQYTHVWAKRNGRWQIVAGHATRLN